MLAPPTRTDRVGNRYLEWYAPHDVFHPGVDFNWGPTANADFGQDVVSPTWGIVEYVSPMGTNGGLGGYLVVYHPHLSAWTRYLHLEAIFVRAGDVVAPHQAIAKLGDSGTTSAHLHFEVLNDKGLAFVRDYKRPYGRYPTGLSKPAVASMWLDPVAWLRDSRHPEPGEDIEARLRSARNALRWANPARRSLLLRLIDTLSDLLKTG